MEWVLWFMHAWCLQGDEYVPSKAAVYTIERYNNLFKKFLARLHRKTKCYGESCEMLEHSIRLLILKWNQRVIYIRLAMPHILYHIFYS
jgi:insertion element IS1 protein InsB